VLPRLLDVVDWTNHAHVAEVRTGELLNRQSVHTQIYVLLSMWPHVDANTALELLGHKYPDRTIRHFAVVSLDAHMQDDTLTKYILPLVQVLRFEAFLDNPLMHFLLRRALANQRLGHMLFWLLRCCYDGWGWK
jgi:phosphatidylinositol-4,5-bisphosphate 3-kinase